MPPSAEARLELLSSVSWELLFLPHRLAFGASTERHQSVVIWGLVSLERKSTSLLLISRLFTPSISMFPFLFPSCTTLLLQLLLFCPLSFLSCVPLLSCPSPELHILPVTIPGFLLLLSCPSPELHILPVTVPGFLLLSCPSPKLQPLSISELMLEMRLRIIYIR